MAESNNLQKNWLVRTALRKSIRSFFEDRNYLEIDTPCLTVCPGVEVHMNFFETMWQDYQGTKHKYWLRSSPELHMKKALAVGLTQVFQVGPCFRNHGEIGPWHLPEFTMIEWYRYPCLYDDMVKESIELVQYCSQSLIAGNLLTSTLNVDDIKIIGVSELFQELSGVKLDQSRDDLIRSLREKKFTSILPHDDAETAFFKIMIEVVEPYLEKQTGIIVLKDYPISTSSLAQVAHGKAQRFEIYLGGIELCNGFQELLGQKQNRERFTETNDRRSALGHEILQADEDFLMATANLTQPYSGVAMGFDRLLALLTNNTVATMAPFESDWH